MKKNKKQPLEVPPIEVLEKELHRELYKKEHASKHGLYTYYSCSSSSTGGYFSVTCFTDLWYVHDADLIRWRHSCLCFWFGI